MKLTRYQPSLAESVFGMPDWALDLDRFFDRSLPASRWSRWGDGLLHQPAVDLYEDKESFQLRVECPGFKREDLTAEVTGGVVTVRGSRKEGEQTWEFERSLDLPGEADPENVEAHYKDGVLAVAFAKRKEAQPKAIQINVQS